MLAGGSTSTGCSSFTTEPCAHSWRLRRESWKQRPPRQSARPCLRRCGNAGWKTTTETRPDGQTTQNWLWATPAKHSTRQLNEVRERIGLLVKLGVDRVLVDLNAALVRRLARRLAARAPSVSARIKDPAPLPCTLAHADASASLEAA